jgi:hypothetical protein
MSCIGRCTLVLAQSLIKPSPIKSDGRLRPPIFRTKLALVYWSVMYGIVFHLGQTTRTAPVRCLERAQAELAHPTVLGDFARIGAAITDGAVQHTEGRDSTRLRRQAPAGVGATTAAPKPRPLAPFSGRGQSALQRGADPAGFTRLQLRAAVWAGGVFWRCFLHDFKSSPAHPSKNPVSLKGYWILGRGFGWPVQDALLGQLGFFTKPL